MGTTNFDLRQSVADYISNIQNQGSLTGSDAAELTAHLYDATEALQKQGLFEEEAFLIACKRLGNRHVLALEYSKVNPTLSANKVWAYLIIGFNMLYSMPVLLFNGIGLLYLTVFNKLGTSNSSTLIITCFHLLFVVSILYIVKEKHRISNFIEHGVQTNALRIVCLSFIPIFIQVLNTLFFRYRDPSYALNYPVYNFNSSFVELSFYLAALSIPAAVISLVFSIHKTGRLTLNMLFEKPSVVFLISFGIVSELLAVSTRAIRTDSILLEACIFGSVYLPASFLIARYNQTHTIKYIVIFSFFGIVCETLLGIFNYLDSEDYYHNVYFVCLQLAGIIAGRLLGVKLNKNNLTPQTG